MGTTLPLQSKTDTSKALEGYTGGLPCCGVAHPVLMVAGPIEKPKDSVNYVTAGFPTKHFLALHVRPYSFLTGSDSFTFSTELQKDLSN